MADRISGMIEKKGEEKFMADVTKEDGTVVQEEQVREIFGLIDGVVEKVDDHTVKLNLPTSDIALIPSFCDYPALIVHRSFDETGADLVAEPDRHRPLDARPASRSACAPSTSGAPTARLVGRRRRSGPVYLDGIEYIDYGTDPSARSPPSRRARSTPATRPPPSYVEIYDALGLTKSEAVTANTVCVRMNVKNPPFDNQAVRNAVQLAVDNATVLDLGYQGLGTVAENHHCRPDASRICRAAADRPRPGAGAGDAGRGRPAPTPSSS